MAVVWGAAKVDGNNGAKLGIEVTVTNNDAQTCTRTTKIWIWTRWSIHDSNNTLYYDNDATSATTNQGNVAVYTTQETGGEYHENNKQLLKTFTATMKRKEFKRTINCAAKLSTVERAGGVLSVKTSYSIPARPQYTLTYNANGGSGAPAADKGYYGISFKVDTKVPKKSGYEFIGWASSSSATSAKWQPGSNITLTGNATIYAVWVKDTAVIRYYANGGEDAPNTQTGTIGNSITLRTAKPTRDEYTFAGWATSSSATSANSKYAPGKSITMPSGGLKLYAVWTPWKHTVAYNANGGSGAPSSATKTAGVTFYLSATKPTRSGYTFKYWTLDVDGDKTIYYPGAKFSINKNGGTTTLYAQWAENCITFDNDNNCECVKFIEGQSLTLNSSGQVLAKEFIEGASSIILTANAVKVNEIIET